MSSPIIELIYYYFKLITARLFYSVVYDQPLPLPDPIVSSGYITKNSLFVIIPVIFIHHNYNRREDELLLHLLLVGQVWNPIISQNKVMALFILNIFHWGHYLRINFFVPN